MATIFVSIAVKALGGSTDNTGTNASAGRDAGEALVGPAWSDFRLTLESGWSQEAAGPLYVAKQSEMEEGWAVDPLLSYTRTPAEDWSEVDFLYPICTWRRFGSEYRFQFIQLFSISGGKNEDEKGTKLFTLFPFYFQKRSQEPEKNYTALVPFYGHLQDRLFHDDIKFVMFPAYAETLKKGVVTDNYLYPFFHTRHGGGVSGWQFWPVVGIEKKVPTTVTNTVGEASISGGYNRVMAAWPFYLKERAGIGTTNEQKRLTIIPFYNRLRSPLRDEDSYGFPFGYWRTDDRGQKYHETDFLWPLFEFADGSKKTTRIFPFYSRASSGGLSSAYYLWPIYKSLQMQTPGLERKHTRIALFLYSDLQEIDRQDGANMHRVDFWPFYTWQRGMDHKERLQVMALLEPFAMGNRSIARDYSQLWSFWVAEKDAKSGVASQSFLWNLYRHESGPQTKKLSLLFGLFQYQSTADGARWRVCGIPFGKKQANLKTARP